MNKSIIAFVFLMVGISGFSQDLVQNIKGRVVDQSTQQPLSFATVVIVDSDPIVGTTTDIEGYYKLENLPMGRYNVEASYVGFETMIVADIVLTSVKEMVVDFEMSEQSTSLDEVVIKPRTTKENAINRMASVSARMLSVEEANRYAGGFDDPARLAASFPGVASSVGNNAIIIRGNAPKFLQWKIEDVEIPNPNHFADLGAFGGGGLSALSSKLLANSDFFTGAFPAEYNNAISGVFDIKMRTGNTSEYEHSIEVGAIGVDFASEGPISRKNNSSYLFNYRYSTLGLISSLLPEDAQGTNYQDLSFKVKLPTEKIGIFSLWGIGLIDNSGTLPESDVALRSYYQDIEDQDVKQYMGAAGINHRLILSNNAYLNSTLAFSTNGIDLKTDRLDAESVLRPENEIVNKSNNITLKSYLNKKFNPKHTNRTGFTFRRMGYDLSLNEVDETQGGLINLVDEKSSTFLLSGYTSSSLKFNKWNFNLGVNGQVFTLNDNFTIEPRLGLSYQINDKNKIGFGYGMHSRLEPLNIYFAKTTNDLNPQANRDLDFAKAHHFVLSYDLNITEKLHLKIEPYYQALFDIPTMVDGTESLLNLQNDWFVSDSYENTGKGQNYGVDLTLEQYMNNGFYFLVSGSIFDSKYKTAESEWFDTRFNKNYLFNALAGKEFRMGKNNNLLGINFRVSVQGGDRYSIIDDNASRAEQDVVFDERVPFTEQTKASTILHFTINYEWYKKKSSHKLSLKILNATNFEEFQGFRYNIKTDEVEEFREALIVPNLSYRYSF